MTGLRSVLRLVALVGVMPLTSGCVAAAMPAMMPAMSHLFTKAGEMLKKPASSGPTVDEAMQEAYDGPKARVGVSRFDVKAASAKAVVGDGLSDMLATALFQSNRFIVLERQALGDILAEQDLGASGRVKHGSAAGVGQIEGAELLVTGVVTEFDPGSAVLGAGVGGAIGTHIGSQMGASGFGYSPTGALVGMAIGQAVGSLRTSHLAIDVRLIDTRTSRIVAATTVEGQAVDFGGGGWSGGSLAVGLAGFSRTPMEKAIRVAVQEAVKFVGQKTPAQYYRHKDAAPTAIAAQPAASFAAEGRSANPAVRAAATAAAMPAPERSTAIRTSGYTATYRVAGTARRVMLNFRVGQRLTQSVRVVIPTGYPWELSFDSKDGDSLFLSAESEDGSGSVSCEILLEGASLTASQSSESQPSVTCAAVASRD